MVCVAICLEWKWLHPKTKRIRHDKDGPCLQGTWGCPSSDTATQTEARSHQTPRIREQLLNFMLGLVGGGGGRENVFPRIAVHLVRELFSALPCRTSPCPSRSGPTCSYSSRAVQGRAPASVCKTPSLGFPFSVSLSCSGAFHPLSLVHLDWGSWGNTP